MSQSSDLYLSVYVLDCLMINDNQFGKTALQVSYLWVFTGMGFLRHGFFTILHEGMILIDLIDRK